jgi:4-amino-4-deoxychorismate lyase
MNLHYHQARMNDSRAALFSNCGIIELEKAILVPDYAQKGVFKCRVIYGTNIERIELVPYSIPRITRMKLVFTDTIEYSRKFLDRSELGRLFDARFGADDIIIVKRGYCTDASFSNIALFDGVRWYTPGRPLLPGTKRQKLLDEGIITEAEIAPSDLKLFQRLSCINAMLDLDEVSVPVSAISV